jgi:hypothetical protein
MKPLPKAGDIWRWQFDLNHFNRDYAHVLLLEQKNSDVWKCLDLDDGDVADWFFHKSDMKHWKHIA